jgi:DNA repair protein RadC
MPSDISRFAVRYELRKIINYDLLVDPAMDFRHPKVCASFLQHLQHTPNEKHFAIFLDAGGHCLGTLEYSGSETTVHIPIGEVSACAILSGARLVVFVHNHPTHLIDGELEFSKSDLDVIEKFEWMLGVFGIKLHDSIIISSDRYTSHQMQIDEKKNREKMTPYQRGDLVLISEELPTAEPEAGNIDDSAMSIIVNEGTENK